MTPNIPRLLEMVQNNFKPGDRIELLSMENDPNPILPGTQGTIIKIGPTPWEVQIIVKWDNGRTLNVLYPQDCIKKI